MSDEKMIGCSRVQKLLSAYTDGELSARQRRAVEGHLAACEGCAGEQLSLRRLVRLTELVPEEDVPAGLRPRIMGLVAALGPVGSRLPRLASLSPWLVPAVGGAAAALVVGTISARAMVDPTRVTSPTTSINAQASAPAASQDSTAVERGTAPETVQPSPRPVSRLASRKFPARSVRPDRTPPVIETSTPGVAAARAEPESEGRPALPSLTPELPAEPDLVVPEPAMPSETGGLVVMDAATAAAAMGGKMMAIVPPLPSAPNRPEPSEHDPVL